MLEDIRVYVMERMYNQKKKVERWDITICPSIRKKIEKMKEQQRYWDVTPSGLQQYEVKLMHEVYGVDLKNRTCGCRSWQLTGIPYLYDITAILFLNGNAEEYVAFWFGSCYRYNVKPRRRRMSGRPKVNRKKCHTEKEGKHIVSKKGVIQKCDVVFDATNEQHEEVVFDAEQQHEDQVPEAEEMDEQVVAEQVVAEQVVADQVVAKHEWVGAQND